MKEFLLLLSMVLFTAGAALAQRTITGNVTNEDGEPLIGASISIKGTSTGTVTDIDGSYRLTVPEEAETLLFSYTGYASREVSLGASDVIDLTLNESAQLLEEVVVTALGFETKRSKVGVASSTVEGDALTRSGEVGLINSLAGKSAGVNITSSSGDPGAGARIQIRGATSITGDVQPLIVIDGVPVFNDTYYGEGFGGQNTASSGSIGSGGGVTQQSRLNDINPEDIESVEVLRGASAAAVWGSRAANGVIVITTKKGRYNPNRPFTVNFNSSVAFDEINKRIPLNETYGRGINMAFQQTPGGGLSWGDRISERPGGDNEYVTQADAFFVRNDEGDLQDLYQGFFQANDGTTYYNLLPSNSEIYDGEGNLLFETGANGGRNSREVYDPYDFLFETGLIYSNSLSVSSATEKGSVYFSLANLSQDGIARENSNYDRTTARLNASRRLGDLFAVDMNAGYTYTSSDRIQMGSNLNGLFLGGLRSAADFDDTDFEGEYVDSDGKVFENRQRAYRNPLGIRNNSIYDNPLWMMNRILSNSEVNRFVGKLELRFDPLDWLNFTARGGLDTYTDEREDFYPVLSAGTNNGGRFTKETITRLQLNFDFIGRARFDLTPDIALNALAGVNLNDRQLDDHGATARSFINQFSPPQLSNATNTELFNREEQVRTAGLYATLGFEVYNQLYVNLSARNDWLSTLPQDNNSIFYPAADVAWQFTRLLKTPRNILSTGRIRAGYGQVGRGPDPYITGIDFYTPTAANTGYGEGWGPGINPIAYGGAFAQSNVAGNPDIKPEIKTEIEAGFDLGFWRDRLNFRFTYYDNKTEDLIIQVATPESVGFVQQVANVGTIENRGVELEIDFDLFRRADWRFNLYGNFTRNRNEVTSMGGTNSVSLAGFSGTSSRAVVGEQLGVVFGAAWDRDESGGLIFDENGFPTQANASAVIGDPNPDFRAGLGGLLNWKRFSLNVLFDHSQGGEIWNGTRGALAFFGRAGNTAVETTLTQQQAENLVIHTGQSVAEAYDFRENADGSYTVRGEVRDFGAGEVFVDQSWYISGPGSGFTGPDEQFMEDATWTRLREATLSYDLPAGTFSWLQGATVSFTGRNLLLWTDYSGNDPDTNLTGSGLNGLGLDYFQNPGTRTYKVTLNLNF